MPGDDLKELALEKEEVDKAFAQDPDINAHGQLYFSLYFGMTGLHALHMIIGQACSSGSSRDRLPAVSRRSTTRPSKSWVCTGTLSILCGSICSRCYI